MKKGDTFNYLKSGKDIYYDMASLISQSVMMVVVNPDRSSPIDVVLDLDEFIEQTNPIGGIFIGFGTAICCTCCIGIICVAIIIQSKRRGGYHAIGYDSSSMNAYNYQPQEYGTTETYGTIGDVTENLYENKKKQNPISQNSNYGSIDETNLSNSQNEIFEKNIENTSNYYTNENNV